MRFDHVTIVVGDIAGAEDVFTRLLGHAPDAAIALPGMAIRSYDLAPGAVHINAPTGPGPVQDYHRARGEGIHHLALGVPDLDVALRELATRGFRAGGAVIDTAPGIREVFLDPATTQGLLIQLVERRITGQATLDPAAVTALADQVPSR